MKEYEYHGYTLRKEERRVGYGFTWAVYKSGQLIGYVDREKLAQETADWHAQYGNNQ